MSRKPEISVDPEKISAGIRYSFDNDEDYDPEFSTITYEDDDEATKETAQIRGEIHTLLRRIHQYFLRYQHERWGSGESIDNFNYSGFRHLTKQQIRERITLIPLRKSQNGTHSLSVGYSQLWDWNNLEFNCVNANNERFDIWIVGRDNTLLHEYALILDPEYRQLVEKNNLNEQREAEAFEKLVIKPNSPMFTTARNYFTETYGLQRTDLYAEIKETLLDHFKEIADSMRKHRLKEYLKTHRMRLLQQFKEDLIDLQDVLITQGLPDSSIEPK